MRPFVEHPRIPEHFRGIGAGYRDSYPKTRPVLMVNNFFTAFKCFIVGSDYVSCNCQYVVQSQSAFVGLTSIKDSNFVCKVSETIFVP